MAKNVFKLGVWFTICTFKINLLGPIYYCSVLFRTSYKRSNCFCFVLIRFLIRQYIRSEILTLLVLKSEYSELTRSIQWLLMPFLIATTGHQHPPLWRCRINRSVFSTRKGFIPEKWGKMQIYFQFPKTTSARHECWITMIVRVSVHFLTSANNILWGNLLIIQSNSQIRNTYKISWFQIRLPPLNLPERKCQKVERTLVGINTRGWLGLRNHFDVHYRNPCHWVGELC